MQQSNKNQNPTSSNSGSSNSNESGASDTVESMVNRIHTQENCSVIKLFKPKFASNIHEARKLMKIRKQLNKLEKRIHENNVISTITPPEIPAVEQIETVPPPLNTSVSVATWDALESKLNSQFDYNSYGDTSDLPERTITKDEEDCLYLSNEIPPETIRYKTFIENLLDLYYEDLSKYSRNFTPSPIENDSKGMKRKLFVNESDLQSDNKKNNNHLIDRKFKIYLILVLSPPFLVRTSRQKKNWH